MAFLVKIPYCAAYKNAVTQHKRYGIFLYYSGLD